MGWQVHGKWRRLALVADGVKDIAATAILRALGDRPVELKNYHRFQELCRRNKNKGRRIR